MLHIISHQQNANQNDNEIPIHTHQDGYNQKKQNSYNKSSTNVCFMEVGLGFLSHLSFHGHLQVRKSVLWFSTQETPGSLFINTHLAKGVPIFFLDRESQVIQVIISFPILSLLLRYLEGPALLPPPPSHLTSSCPHPGPSLHLLGPLPFHRK